MSAAEKPNLSDIGSDSPSADQARARIELETAALMNELSSASAERRKEISLRIVDLGEEYAALEIMPSLLGDLDQLSAQAEAKLGDLDGAAEMAFPNLYDQEMARLRETAHQIESELETASPELAEQLEERLGEVGLEYARVLSSKMAIENDPPSPSLSDSL